MNVLRRASLTVAPTGPTGVLPEIAARADEAIAIRHDLHRHPELAFEEHRTSARVAELLQQWGYTAVSYTHLTLPTILLV